MKWLVAAVVKTAMFAVMVLFLAPWMVPVWVVMSAVFWTALYLDLVKESP